MGTTITNQNSVLEQTKNRLKSAYSGNQSIKNLHSVSQLSRNVMMKIYKIIIIKILFCICMRYDLQHKMYYYDDQNKEDKIGRACGRHRSMTLTYGRIILKCILEKENGEGGLD